MSPGRLFGWMNRGSPHDPPALVRQLRDGGDGYGNVSDARTKVASRIAELTDWLQENAPTIMDDQKHLDAGTAEQAYWHYGYLMALRDMRKNGYLKDLDS
jgi:hypothetical protein